MIEWSSIYHPTIHLQYTVPNRNLTAIEMDRFFCWQNEMKFFYSRWKPRCCLSCEGRWWKRECPPESSDRFRRCFDGRCWRRRPHPRCTASWRVPSNPSTGRSRAVPRFWVRDRRVTSTTSFFCPLYFSFDFPNRLRVYWFSHLSRLTLARQTTRELRNRNDHRSSATRHWRRSCGLVLRIG